MSHLQDLSLREQASGVASGDIDAGELLAATFARMDERDGALNSVVDRFPDEAERMLAEAAGRGERGPLFGVPVLVKDMFQLPWRAPRDGSDHEQLPPGESAVFGRLRDAGAVVAGVTNMHLYGAGTTGHQSAYGPCATPWDPARCAGGSSSGSGAAVGARIAAGAVGTDGAGSIRTPAAYSGITGLKATWRGTPPEGFTHGYSSMAVGGPMCRDAADARLLGETLMGRRLPAAEGGGLRVGIVRDPFWDDLDPDVDRLCRAALEAAGWQIEEIALDGARHSMIASVLRLTLEVLPHHRAEEILDADPVMRALAKYQLLVPANGLVRADRVRAQLRRSIAAAFERCDLIAWPTSPAPSPPLDNPTVELPSGIVPADKANTRQSGFANLTGVPSISVPVGLHPSGLPVGLQIHAAWGEEARLLDAAEHLERATDREHVEAVPPIAAGTAA